VASCHAPALPLELLAVPELLEAPELPELVAELLEAAELPEEPVPEEAAALALLAAVEVLAAPELLAECEVLAAPELLAECEVLAAPELLAECEVLAVLAPLPEEALELMVPLVLLAAPDEQAPQSGAARSAHKVERLNGESWRKGESFQRAKPTRADGRSPLRHSVKEIARPTVRSKWNCVRYRSRS
jgi:hypothetical protein